MPLDSTGTTHTAPRTAAREDAALNWHDAVMTKRTATADKDRRTREAIKLGVLFDHEKNPKPPGYSGTVYAGGRVTISVTVGQPGDKLDEAAFVKALAKHVEPALVARLVKRHRSPTAAPHTFTSSLVT